MPAKDKERGTQQADPCPQVVQRDLLFHVQDGKRHEHRQRDDLLKNLELPQRHDLMTDAIGGHLDQVFKEGDPPADKRGNQPGFGRHVFQVTVPRERHEHVAA